MIQQDREENRPLKYLPSLLLFVFGIASFFLQTFERWDRFVYDSLSAFTSRSQPDHIVIIAIDEYSLQQYGRWPWPRSTHAELIDKLTLGGAKAIGLDILFTEPDRVSTENDQLLAEAIERSGRVILPVISEMNPAENRLQLTKPIPLIAAKAAGLGHVDFELDSDGIMRRVYLLAGHGEPKWEAMSLALLHLSRPSLIDDLPGKKNTKLETSSPENWVRDHEILLPFAGDPGHYWRISYAKFMHPDFDPGVVNGKYVFVGTTAIGLGDTLPTPVSGESVPMSGVELNTNLLDVLEQNLAITPIQRGYGVLITALLILLPLLLYPFLSQRKVQLMVLFSLLFSLCLSIVMLTQLQLWFPPVTAMLIVFISYPVWAWYRLEKLVRNLFKEKEKALVTLHSIGDGVITTDTDGWVEYLNPIAEKLTGYTSAESRGKHLKDVFPVVDEDIGRDRTLIIEDCLRKSQVIRLEDEAILTNRTGKEHALQVSAGPIKDQSGAAVGVVLGISDVTEKRRALRELSYRATHDFLTGLPNRSLLTDRLQQAISRANRANNVIAVLFIDLDNFKKINDQLGHTGGDSLLKLVSDLLLQSCRDEDTVARIGGDEFVILLEGISDLTTAANIAGKLIEYLEKPIRLEGHDLFISGSIGISMFPRDGEKAEELLKNADIAMYEVKKKSRNAYMFFSEQMNEIIQQKIQIESELRTALERNELQLYYQPQVRLADNKIIGVEALLRWISEDKGMIATDSFIPIAEESGLILPLSEWVIYSACKQAKTWQDDLDFQVNMAVNLSPRQFLEEDLPDKLNQIIRETKVNRKMLDLEITEGLIMQDVERSTEILREFQERGGLVSIDDFGTGYSSLAYLKQFPLDKLKIDQSFIQEIDTDAKNKGLVQTIITMGHSLNLKIVAEGAETQEHIDILRSQKCDIIQGYYFSQPLPADELTRKLKQSAYF